MLNSIFCTFPIEKHQLVRVGIFLDHALTVIPSDIIDRLCYHFIFHVSTIAKSDQTVLFNIISQMALMSVRKSSGYWSMNSADQFDQAVVAYQAKHPICHDTASIQLKFITPLTNVPVNFDLFLVSVNRCNVQLNHSIAIVNTLVPLPVTIFLVLIV